MATKKTNRRTPSKKKAAVRAAKIRAKPSQPAKLALLGEVTAPANRRPFPIVGIGASAGGIEALTQFFKALPRDPGMAFVVVQHLDPTHASVLADILGRTTPIPVSEVSDEPEVEPNHVYVIPPGRSMIIRDGRLRLLPRQTTRPHRPIDAFLSSLAQDHGHRAIGVILSGTGNDGTFGLEAIKTEGGISFAQDATASHDTMPQSAISAGCVDFVLPPWGIAEELSRIGQHPFVAHAGDPSESIRAGSVAKILSILQETSGVDFTHYKSTTLYRRIARRMLLHKLEGLREYIKLLETDRNEVQALYRDVLINVTSFFRDPPAFEILKQRVFPRIGGERNRKEPVRLWVLGCSTGEEAYSLAIALAEFCAEEGHALSAQIFATDLSDRAIETARAGLYPKSIAQGISPERLRRYFVETESGYQIVKSIREMCVFARHNVLSDPPFSRMDLISCRNVLIYMDPVLQRKVVPVLYYALRQNGCLWLGTSETIGTFSDLFKVEDQKYRIYLKINAASQPTPVLQAPRRSWDTPPPHAIARPRLAETGTGLDSQREADRLALAKYAPPGVLLNEELDVLQFRGDTSDYLAPAPGRPSVNVLKMAREGLMVGLRAALQKAARAGTAVRHEGLRVKTNGGAREVDVQIFPVRGNVAGERCWLVQFEERDHTAPQEPDVPRLRNQKPQAERGSGTGPLERAEREIELLTDELASTREYMQTLLEQQEAANEELQSANEEVQSSNEELQSINEELQTSKEEIQSSNEELTTVNEELRNSNEELSQSNDDLVNFLASTDLALVMVSSELKIRSFTPHAGKILHLIRTDVGRPIGDIRLPFKVSDVEGALANVIKSVTTSEREVQAEDEHWYSLRLRPYRTVDNKIDGAVLVLIDIDQQKRAVEELRQSDRRKDEFLATLAHELRTPLTTLSLGFEILQRGDNEKAAERIQAMDRQVWKLKRLVDDLLELSRIGRGTLLLRKTNLDLRTLVERAAEAFRGQLEDKQRTFVLSLPPHPVRMNGDPIRLEQVVTNLLSNAAKFTEGGGTIELELALIHGKNGSARARLSVVDNGIGIDTPLLPHIFEMFAQAESSRSRDQGGLGVGLYLVQRLVDMHGGSVSAHSEGLGLGTRFEVLLPVLSGDELKRGPGPEAPPPSAPGAPRRVLVVDDNADAAEAIAQIFKLSGHEVRIAYSGPDAIEAARQYRPHAIFMDIGMPGMNGYEAARLMRERSEFDDVLLIALTGYGRDQDVQRSREAGFDEHLVKPPSLDMLEEALSRSDTARQRRAFRGPRLRSDA